MVQPAGPSPLVVVAAPGSSGNSGGAGTGGTPGGAGIGGTPTSAPKSSGSGQNSAAKRKLSQGGERGRAKTPRSSEVGPV